MLAFLANAVAPDLVQLIDEHHARGRAAWPTVTLSVERFREHVEQRVRDRASEPAEDVVRSLPAADIYLAAACSDGDPAALTAFRDSLVPTLRPALGKLGMTAVQIDETIQRVLVMVFVGDNGPPQIRGYGGRGTLRSWLRTIAVRTGRRLLGIEGSAVAAEDELEHLPAAVADPEIELLRGRHRDQVKQAFAAAFADLAERERNVLRQYHIDGLTIDQLAALYQVNRATTARWVAGARLAVITKTRQQLVEHFGVAASEVDSIIRLVRSQLDVSVRDMGR
jgi:RNA polymerase sigma-70 factor (ECF subfamily)